MDDQQYLLSDDVLVAFPELIGATALGTQVCVADVTLRRLDSLRALGVLQMSYAPLIVEAAAHGSPSVIDTAGMFPGRYSFLRMTSDGSFEDELLVSIAKEIGAVLVTDDSTQRRLAETSSVSVVSGMELKERIRRAPLGEHLIALINRIRRIAAFELFLPVGIIACWKFGVSMAKTLLRLRLPWLTAVVVLVAGVALFGFRKFSRVSYGSLEVLVGMVGGWNAGHLQPNWIAFLVQMFGSIYIIVWGRGPLAARPELT
jgi:hypothetical protein